MEEELGVKRAFKEFSTKLGYARWWISRFLILYGIGM
jgi:hypothetical protein